MTLTIRHYNNGTFAAVVPSPDGPQIVFSARYASDSNRESQYDVLSALLKLAFGLVIPPLNETNLMEPGTEQEITAKIA